MKPVLLMMLLLLVGPRDTFAADGYFMVKDPTEIKANLTEVGVVINPVNMAETFWQEVVGGEGELYQLVGSLLEFDFHNQRYGDVAEPYKRERHFGKWIVDTARERCLNTRAQVLIRDSRVAVTLRSSGCSVEAGEWSDPYSGQTLYHADEVQIDHFVPLKNAYMSGASRWSFQKRCLYANFLGNSFHLLPVAGDENQRKSDHTPEEYMPKNNAYRCQYLQQWLKAKLIWSLALSTSEKKSVSEQIQKYRCSADMMTMSQSELIEQRRFIADNINLCH